jgi:nitrite reductase/ring-hydroxylating ferredoxin subunit
MARSDAPPRQGRAIGMAEREKLIGKASEFKDGDRRIVFLGNTEVGVFRDKGEFYAYSNYCLHQGGPACEGLTIAKVEERIMPDKTSRGLYFSEEELHFVCPWHGYEYDMKTGECVSDRRLKLRKYQVVQKGDDLYVVA